MEKKERRKNKRCNQDTGIAYSFLNQTEQHAALARNYSKSGMYFESNRPLIPGTTIVVRTIGCNPAYESHAGNSEQAPEPYYCKDSQLRSEACQEIKTLAVAQVRYCENFKDLDNEQYGIGVHYISPAV